jgi:hypothetical protein
MVVDGVIEMADTLVVLVRYHFRFCPDAVNGVDAAPWQ